MSIESRARELCQVFGFKIKDDTEIKNQCWFDLATHVEEEIRKARLEELFSTLGTKGIAITDSTFIQKRITELRKGE